MFKKILILLMVLGVILTPALALATHNPNHPAPGATPGGDESGLREGTIFEFVQTTIKTVLGVVGAILLVLIVYGGFVYATAAGNDENVTKGKNILIYAIVGIIIIAIAWILTDFIIGGVLLPQE